MKDSTVYTAVHTVQYAVTVQGFFENWNTVFLSSLVFFRVLGVKICKITVFWQWPINFLRYQDWVQQCFLLRSNKITGFYRVFVWILQTLWHCSVYTVTVQCFGTVQYILQCILYSIQWQYRVFSKIETLFFQRTGFLQGFRSSNL